jgi:hypothetical protein
LSGFSLNQHFYGQFWRGHQTIIWRTGKGFVQCSCLNGLSILKSISSWRKIGDYTPVINLDAHQDRGRAGIGLTEFPGVPHDSVYRNTVLNITATIPTTSIVTVNVKIIFAIYIKIIMAIIALNILMLKIIKYHFL